MLDDRTGQTSDYSRKAGVIHVEVITPKGSPDWMHDRAQLWNAVEAVERRKDAQLAREIQLSLPHELDQAQRKALLLDFVQEQFVDKGMIADVAIHAPNAKGDERNHHAHVMLTMRELTGECFGKKARDWNSPDQLAQWREQWAHHQNRTLERHGHAARVDHRSFEAQGIDREPTQHLGPTASDMERGGKASRIGNERRDKERKAVALHKRHSSHESALSRLPLPHQRPSPRRRTSERQSRRNHHPSEEASMTRSACPRPSLANAGSWKSHGSGRACRTTMSGHGSAIASPRDGSANLTGQRSQSARVWID